MKIIKILGVIAFIGIVAGTIFYLNNNEKIPDGKQGIEADNLAHKMLEALNIEAYNKTQYLEWGFNKEHFYKWDKVKNSVKINWENKEVILDTKAPEKSIVRVDGKEITDAKILKEATDNFNNDSFWLVAPYKVFEDGIERRLVNYEGQDALLITYTTGGSTPGDSYLWILEENGMPKSFKMWVSIIPVGGAGATWDNWITTDLGAKLPKTHIISGIGELDMGDVKAYN